MKCGECDRKVKDHPSGQCKACRLDPLCIRCEKRDKALRSLCLECHATWVEVEGAAWRSFMSQEPAT